MKREGRGSNQWNKEEGIVTIRKGLNALKLFFKNYSFSDIVKGFSGTLLYLFVATSYYPIVVFFFIIFLREVNLRNFCFFLFSFFLQYLVSMIFRKVKQVNDLKQLNSHIQLLEELEYKITPYSIDDYIYEGETQELIREFFPSIGNRAIVGKVLSITPSNPGYEFGQFKGFQIGDFAWPESPGKNPIDLRKKILSVAIIRGQPDTLSTMGRFFLFHEIAHLSEFAESIRHRGNVHFFNLLVILALYFMSCSSLDLSLVLILFVFYLYYFWRYNKENIERIEEEFCDGFAIGVFDDEDEINMIVECIKRRFGEERYINILKNLGNISANHNSDLAMSRIFTVIAYHNSRDTKEDFIYALFYSSVLIFFMLAEVDFSILYLFLLVVGLVVLSNIFEFLKIKQIIKLPPYLIFEDAG